MSEVEELMDEFEVDEGVFVPPPRELVNELVDVPSLMGPGIYALLRGDVVIYIGKAKVLIQRLYAHWNTADRVRRGKLVSDKNNVKTLVFTGIKVFPCHASDLDKIERQLIARYRPKYNHRLVPKGKMTLEQCGFDFTRLGITQVEATPVFRRRF